MTTRRPRPHSSSSSCVNQNHTSTLHQHSSDKSNSTSSSPEINCFSPVEKKSHVLLNLSILFIVFPALLALSSSGNIATNKWPLLLSVLATTVASLFHWTWVRYGGIRHIADGLIATGTVIFHEIWAVVDFTDESHYRNDSALKSTLGTAATTRIIHPNVLREYLSGWPQMFALIMLINFACVAAYLTGWICHGSVGRENFEAHVTSVRQGLYYHFLFRFFAFWGIMIVYMADLNGLDWNNLLLIIIGMTFFYWVPIILVWKMFERGLRREAILESRKTESGKGGGYQWEIEEQRGKDEIEMAMVQDGWEKMLRGDGGKGTCEEAGRVGEKLG